jgi:hypothetical protein
LGYFLYDGHFITFNTFFFITISTIIHIRRGNQEINVVNKELVLSLHKNEFHNINHYVYNLNIKPIQTFLVSSIS